MRNAEMNFGRILTGTAIVILLIANIFLQRRNSQLFSRIETLEASNVPQAGSKIAVLGGMDLSGKMVSIDFSHQDDTSLVLFFSPICRFSQKNWPNWNHLVASFPNAKVLYVDGTDLSSEDFFLQMRMPVPKSALKLSGIYKSQLHLNVTPTTLVLGPQGRVKRAFGGVLDSSEMADLASALR